MFLNSAAYTADGRQHMEYVRERGSFDDLPFEEIMGDFRATYPRVLSPRSRKQHRSTRPSHKRTLMG